MKYLLNFSELNEDFSLYLEEEDLFSATEISSTDAIFEENNSGPTEGLKKKSKASGIPLGILRKVFSKGAAAWNKGHFSGVAQQQWAMGRVNSFITGKGGARKADADLWAKAKAAKAKKKKK